MKDTRKLKQLESQLNTAKADVDIAKIEVQTKQQELNNKKGIVKRLEQEIAKLSGNKTPRVSEHAIIRYIERVKKLDVTHIEKEILSDPILKMIETLGGTGKYPSSDNTYKVVMKDYVVTTIITGNDE